MATTSDSCLSRERSSAKNLCSGEQLAADIPVQNSAISAPAVTVQPAKNLAGSVRVPGDKSISHRYAMLAAVAEGVSELENFSSGADCASTLSCLRALGR